jgi:hypothetical protein
LFLASLSEGYPHFLQQFGNSAFESDTDQEITIEDVTEGAFSKTGALSRLGRKFFQELYFDKIGSDDYRTVLQNMALNGDSWRTRAQIIEGCGLKEYTINNALAALKDRGIIVPNESTKGSYRLPSKSFATWIRAMNSAPEPFKSQLLHSKT